MNTKKWPIFLTLATLAGCASTSNVGDVWFTWTFDGLGCTQAGVSVVTINIPGERLEGDGVYSCLNAGYNGIVLRDFNPGTYSFRISATDITNKVLYQVSGSFVLLRGDAFLRVDLKSDAKVSAYLRWSFPSNASCAEAGWKGIAYVDVQIDQSPRVERHACTEGQTTPGASVLGLLPGGHTIRLTAFPADASYAYYSTAGTLDVLTSTAVSASYSLQWAVGGVAVRWWFGSGQDCTTTGVDTVYVNFTDAIGSFYSPLWDRRPCTGGTSGSIDYDFLPAGTYVIEARGTGTTRSYSAAVPGFSINPGQFSNVQSVLLTLN